MPALTTDPKSGFNRTGNCADLCDFFQPLRELTAHLPDPNQNPLPIRRLHLIIPSIVLSPIPRHSIHPHHQQHHLLPRDVVVPHLYFRSSCILPHCLHSAEI